MAYFLGFDVAKLKLDYSLINEQGIELTNGKVANDELAIATLLLSINGNYPGASITAVVEATGCYHNALCETAYELSIGCLVYNPILTRRRLNLRLGLRKQIRLMP